MKSKATSDQKGFTLVELLIAMAISLIVLGGVYTTYRTQQKAYVVQDQTAQMQQSLRAAMYFVEADLRMAGYDADRGFDLGVENDPGATPAYSDSDHIGFTLYGDDNCYPDENGSIRRVQYYTDPDANLTKQCSGPSGNSVVAPFIEAIDFVYILQNGTPTDNPADGDLDNIRSIEVTMIARAEKEDRDYTDAKTFSNAQGTAIAGYPKDDHYRRMSLTKRIRCRNLGL